MKRTFKFLITTAVKMPLQSSWRQLGQPYYRVLAHSQKLHHRPLGRVLRGFADDLRISK